MTCDECKAARPPESVPYIVHESAMARTERAAKRLWAAIILLIVLLVGTNCAWIYFESQFETVSTTFEVDQNADNGTNNFAGGDLNGASAS